MNMEFKKGIGWKACFNPEDGRYTAEYGGSGAYHLYEISEDNFDTLKDDMKESEASTVINKGRHLYMDINDRCGPPYTVVFDEDYRKLCSWAGIVSSSPVWPENLTDTAVELLESEKKNRDHRRNKRKDEE